MRGNFRVIYRLRNIRMTASVNMFADSKPVRRPDIKTVDMIMVKPFFNKNGRISHKGMIKGLSNLWKI